jgi:uncharacterized SAM-binding protein YcdF (DUF218 family)
MKIRPKLFVKKQVCVPTALGWLLLVGGLALLSFFGVANTYSFLAYNHPNQADVFIIEGWVPDHVLQESLDPCTEGHTRLFLTTGGRLEVGADLSQYRTYAEFTAARLVKLGIGEKQIVAVPGQAVDKDRTYAAALAVKDWLRSNPGVDRATLITKGPHARRSFVTFKKVLPSTFELGVCAIPPRDYDPQRWWASSEGFRTVVSEGIAYAYARFIGPR